MKKLLVVVAVLTMTAVGYGEDTSGSGSSTTTTTTKTKTVTKKVKKASRHKKSRKKAAAAPAASAITTPPPTPVPAPVVETAPIVPSEPATTSIAPSTVEAIPGRPSESKAVGFVDLRPSWTTKSGEMHTENEAALGWAFNRNNSLAYHQNFNTNLYDPSGAGGLKLKAKDGFVKAKFNNLAGNNAGIGFSYETRAYLPTDSGKEQKGMVTIWRNYFKARHDFGSVFYLTVMEVPILHAYDRAGGSAGGKDYANPIFENRVYLVPGFNLTSNLTLELPIIMQNILHRDFSANAAFNNGWEQVLWIYPELDWAVTPNLTVGAAYYNDNFLANSTFGSFKAPEGLEGGYPQLVVRASL